jgi:hypothetical protein
MLTVNSANDWIKFLKSTRDSCCSKARNTRLRSKVCKSTVSYYSLVPRKLSKILSPRIVCSVSRYRMPSSSTKRHMRRKTRSVLIFAMHWSNLVNKFQILKSKSGWCSRLSKRSEIWRIWKLRIWWGGSMRRVRYTSLSNKSCRRHTTSWQLSHQIKH